MQSASLCTVPCLRLGYGISVLLPSSYLIFEMIWLFQCAKTIKTLLQIRHTNDTLVLLTLWIQTKNHSSMLCCFAASKLGRIKRQPGIMVNTFKQEDQEFKASFDYNREFEASLDYSRP